jgi:hypothetical protein
MPHISVRFEPNFQFSRRILRTTPSTKFHPKKKKNPRPAKAELFHPDGRQDKHDQAKQQLFATSRTPP